MSIHGYAAYEPKKELKTLSYEPEDLRPDEVEIAITHCGICHSDIHLIDNDWQTSSYPFIPGHEIVGTISRVGSNVQTLSPGQRVGLGWQAGSCGQCEWCAIGEETSCPRQVATCVGRHGGYANAVRAQARFAIPVPDSLESENAAPLLCGGATVYTPLSKWVRPSMRLGVIGIGGLGHLALQFASAYGCEVTAFSTSPDKEDEARSLGAHYFVATKEKNALQSAAGTLDFILSAVTADLDWPAWMSVLRPNGTLCLVGASPGPLNVLPFQLIAGHKSIRGSAIGDPRRIAEMLEFAARHGIKAKTEKMPLAEVNAALEKVRAGKARYRMVLEV